MVSTKRALLFIGSPVKLNSTSDSLGTYLLNELERKGFQISKYHVTQLINYDGTETGTNPEFFVELDKTDIFIMSFPLHIDSLPAITIRALEVIRKHRQEHHQAKKPLLAAIANSGFPEPHQNSTALEICRCFGEESGFQWAGSLAVGGGAIIQGKPVKKVVFQYKNLIKSLTTNRRIPIWLSIFAAKIGARLVARKNGVNLYKLFGKDYL